MKILAINHLVPIVLKIHCDNGSIVDRVLFLDNEKEIAYENNGELSLIDGKLKQDLFNKLNKSDDFFVASASNDSIVFLEKNIENFIKEQMKITEEDKTEETEETEEENNNGDNK